MTSDRPGDRVELVSCADPWTDLEPDELGTVVLIDAFGTVDVQWASGVRLGLVPHVDEWRNLGPPRAPTWDPEFGPDSDK